MIRSLRYLLSAPYNKKHPASALYRFLLWKYIRLFKLKDYKFKIWNDREVYINADSVQSMWLMYNYWVDWEEFHLMKDFFKKDDVVLDIGANIGLYSLWMSRFITNGNVHSFEPDNTNYARLEKNIALNKLSNVVVINKKGVADKTGTIYLTQNQDVQNHVTRDAVPGAIQIDTITLDEYVEAKGIRNIRYLKIDIEGFEMPAFRGAERLLKSGMVEVIQLEINSAQGNSGATERQLVDYLGSFGYQLACYDIENRKLKKLEYSEERENYFAVRDIEKFNNN